MRRSQTVAYVSAAASNADATHGTIETNGAESITLHFSYVTSTVGTIIFEGSEDTDRNGSGAPTLWCPLELPVGCLHRNVANVALGVFAAGEGVPIELTAGADTQFIVILRDPPSFLRTKLDRDSGGAAAGTSGLYIDYTLKFPTGSG